MSHLSSPSFGGGHMADRSLGSDIGSVSNFMLLAPIPVIDLTHLFTWHVVYSFDFPLSLIRNFVWRQGNPIKSHCNCVQWDYLYMVYRKMVGRRESKKSIAE